MELWMLKMKTNKLTFTKDRVHEPIHIKKNLSVLKKQNTLY